MRKRTVFISFFTSCTQTCPSDLSAHTHPVCDVCVRPLWLSLCKRRKSRARSKAEASISVGCVCALRSLGHGCVQEVKKRYKYCSFSHTNRSFRVLGHQCVVTMGNCLIWISLCMFFFPLIEKVTYTCHYMTDRLERFDLKTSKLDLLKKKRHLHLGCPWGKLIDTKF